MVQDGARSIHIVLPIFCLKIMLVIVKIQLFMRKDIALTRVCLVKYFLLASLEVQQIDVLEKPFLTLDLKSKLITSDSSFSSLCGMIVYRMHIGFILLSDNGKRILQNSEFLTA